MRDPNIERMEEFARTGLPMPVQIDVRGDGVIYEGSVRVTKKAYGEYECQAATKLRRRFIFPRLSPDRLP